MRGVYSVMDEHGRRNRFFTKDARDAYMAENPLRRKLTHGELSKFWYRDRVGSVGRQGRE